MPISPHARRWLIFSSSRTKPAALRLAAGIAAVLVVATAVSAWLAVRATRAEKRTTESLGQVVAERDAKEVARKDAETISRFLSDVFQSPDPSRDGRTITVAELALQGKLIASSTFKNTSVYTMVALMYLALSLPLILLVRHFEKKASRK